MRDAGVEIDDLILQPLASGGPWKESEREMGVILADVGGGTTDIAIFIEGSIWHTVVLGTGGEHLTRRAGPAHAVQHRRRAQDQVRPRHARLLLTDESIEITSFATAGRESVCM